MDVATSTIMERLQKLSLQNGDYFVVCQKSPIRMEDGSNNDHNNTSEILIDFSDDEEENETTQNTLSRVQSTIFESTPTSESKDFSSEEESSDKRKTEENTNNKTNDFENREDMWIDVNHVQTNMNARIAESCRRIKEESKTKKESAIICTYQNKYQFVLRFLAVNVKMTFMRFAERRMTDEVCEKFVQPKSTYHYTNYIDLFSSRLLLTRKNHVLASEKITSKSQIKYRSHHKKVKKEKSDNNISKVEKAEVKSLVYLIYNSVIFECYPPNLAIESMKQLYDEENRGASGDVIDSHKNRGSILIKHKQDLLLFKFDMLKVNFEQIIPKTSRSTQSKDFDHYIKYYSYPCDKMLHCSIPISTYKYRDPLRRIRYLNRNLIINRIPPEWIPDERRKRLKRFCQLKEMSATRKFELNFKSIIQFQSHFGTLCRIRIGLQKGILVAGDYHYERMAMSYQRQKLGIGKNEKEPLFMTEIKHRSMEVLDCNLNSYDL